MVPLGELTRDGNNNAVQVGNSFVTSDGAASPKTSPLAYTSTVQTITVPPGAVEFIVTPSSALRISEVANMATYDVVASATKEAIACARMQYIYIKEDASDGTVDFRFTII